MLTQYSIPREIVGVEPRHKEYAMYLGDYSVRGYSYRQTSDEKLAFLWHNMMSRCYKVGDPRYAKYGAKGTFVCRAWHNLEVFLQEVKEIPHWEYKLKEPSLFYLDKDYYSANCYSKETCVWVTRQENNVYCHTAKPVRATHLLTKEVKVFLSIGEAARFYGIDGNLSMFVSGGKDISNTSKVAGFKFELIESDRLLRYKLMGELNDF